jgi:glycine hydroxymethyltransferase
LDGNVVETVLDKIGLTLNKNAVANDPLPPFRPSGIRLGTPAMTTRGLVEDDMAQIADWMHQAVEHREDAARLEELRTAVREFAVRYPLPSDK